MRQFYLDGTASSQFAIYVSSDTFLNAPAFDYEEYTVPNVNGSLLKVSNRMQNVIRRFDCFCKNYPQVNLEDFKRFLYSKSGYMRIESDYDPLTYQMGFLAEQIEFEPFDADGAFEAKFSLYFSCKPQKFFKHKESSEVVYDPQSQSGFLGVYSRNSKQIQQLFNYVPVDLIPTSNQFAVFILATANNGEDEFTNINAAVAGSAKDAGWLCIAGVTINGSNESFAYVGATWNAGINGLTYRYGFNIGTTSVAAVIPADAYLNGSLYGSAFVNGSTQVFDGYDSSRNHNKTEISNANAIGQNMSINAMYAVTSSARSAQKAGVHVIGKYVNGALSTICFLRMHFEQMTADDLADIVSHYMNPSGYMEVLIDENYNAYATNGPTKKKLTSYLEVVGDMHGNGETVVCVPVYVSDSGSAYAAQLSPEWWTV